MENIMSKHLNVEDIEFIARRFKQARDYAELTRLELVQKAGYENIDKGLRRLDRVESGEPPLEPIGVYKRFAEVLPINLARLWDSVKDRIDERAAEKAAEHARWLGPFLKRAREQQGMTVEEVYRKVGEDRDFWSAERLQNLESGTSRFASPGERIRLARVLDVAPVDLENAQRLETEYYDGLEGNPSIVVRLVAACYTTAAYPDDMTTAEILDFARNISGERRLRCCVVLQDTRSVFVNAHNHEFEKFSPPRMRIGDEEIQALPPLKFER